MKITKQYKKDLLMAMRAAEKGNAYHWPTVAEILADEIKRLSDPTAERIVEPELYSNGI